MSRYYCEQRIIIGKFPTITSTTDLQKFRWSLRLHLITISISLLQINSTNRSQWKLLLEQNSIGYTYPDETSQFSESQGVGQTNQTDSSKLKQRNSEEDWQIILPVPTTSPTDPHSSEKPDNSNESDQENIDPEEKDEFEHIAAESSNSNSNQSNNTQAQSSSGGAGIFPAARARLASLRDLGAKKIGALKLKLIENKIKSTERGKQQQLENDNKIPHNSSNFIIQTDRNRQQLTTLACMELPSFQPEILTTSSGPHFIAQFLKDTHLLSALHSYSDTLSVSSIVFVPDYSCSCLTWKFVFFYSGSQHGHKFDTTLYL